MRGAGRALALSLLAGAGLAAHALDAAAQSTLEYSVKATYLVRFAAFATWTDGAIEPGAPLVLCVAGRDPFGEILNRAANGQTANGRALAVRRPTSSDLRGCHIAYLGRDAIAPLNPPSGVLLVTDEAVAARRGAIHFVVVGGRVRFHVDKRLARAAGIDLSSRLLALALSVRGGE